MFPYPGYQPFDGGPQPDPKSGQSAIETASKSLRELRIGEVTKLDLKVEDGKLLYRTRLNLSFKYTGGE